jgi:hypothetical protein
MTFLVFTTATQYGLRSAFAGTHTDTERLGSNRLIREDFDPYITATLHVASHRNTGGFNLVAGDPAGFFGLDSPFTIGNLIAAGSSAGHTATLYLAVFGSFGH